MAISYKVVSKRPGGMAGENTPKYYPALTKREIMHTRELAEEISKGNSFSPADIMGVIAALAQAIPKHLKNGKSIKLDYFGTFSLHISGKGQEDPKKVTKRDITGIKMAFLPSKEMKNVLKTTSFEKVK